MDTTFQRLLERIDWMELTLNERTRQINKLEKINREQADINREQADINREQARHITGLIAESKL
jgi:hypothetical protein